MKRIVGMLAAIAMIMCAVGFVPVNAQKSVFNAYITNFSGDVCEGARERIASFDELKNFIPESGDVNGILSRYDESFFDDGFLYFHYIYTGSGGDKYNIIRAEETETSIDIEVTRERSGYSDDINSWVAVLEADKSLYDKDITVTFNNMSRYKVRYYGDNIDPYRLSDDEDIRESMTKPYIVKIGAYEDLPENYKDTDYKYLDFDKYFLLVLNWLEPRQVRTLGLANAVEGGDCVDIELFRFIPGGEYPEVISPYCAVLEMPRENHDKDFNVKIKGDNDDLEISTAEGLRAFADSVNGGNTYRGKTVTLGADIDLSSVCGADINGEEVSWVPIGRLESKFNGTFDGGGHTISGLYINSEYEDFAGLFYFTDTNSVIKNLTVDGFIKVGYESDPMWANMPSWIGGIAGLSAGKIKNCRNKATIQGIGNGVYASGICSSDGTVENCINTGSISSGYVAYAIAYGLAAENCFYLENTASDAGGAEAKTAGQFASGEVAYLLGEPWGQKIGADEYPVIGGDKVYFVNGGYTNTQPECGRIEGRCSPAGASLALYDGDLNLIAQTISGEDEMYAFENVSPGTYSISGAKYNYVRRTIFDITVAAGAATTVNIILPGDDTPPKKIVTVNPPAVNIKSGEVPYGTKVTISPTDGNDFEYSVNGAPFVNSRLINGLNDTVITLTEDTVLVVRSMIDAVEQDTEYVFPEATYTYIIGGCVIPPEYPYMINSVKLVSESGEEYDVPPAGKSFIVDVEITEQAGRNEKDYFIVAAYDTDGALISMNYIKADFPAGTSVSYGINISKTDKTIGSVKAFVWDTLGGMEPLAKTVELWEE
ncbi:MAG: carboxypeptidase regulatory-like domain-containing protein [Oscillospiraceae bacterium]|nr:carboxypeptidase regulatory-like domain-containing protein [Oscillospiraceae bacterium]